MIRWAEWYPVGLLLTVFLGGCLGQEHQDLRDWMDEQSLAIKDAEIEPTPQVIPYQAFTYNAFDLSDPFKPRKIQLSKGQGGPDLNRRKEALEVYPLETLMMVGTLQRGKEVYAIIKTSDKGLFRVKPGNYMGQNYGLITGVSESEVHLKELVQDPSGEWVEQSASLQLVEAQEQKK